MHPKRLYIIGNGFDLHHGINSDFKGFEMWLLEQRQLGGCYDVEEVQRYFKCENLWSDFEEKLGSINYSEFVEDFACGIFPSDPADTLRCKVEESLSDWHKVFWDSLPDWLKQLSPANPDKKIDIDISEAVFINFNYTETLEEVYGVPSSKVLHIHGKLGDPPEKLLLGHGGLIAHTKNPFLDNSIEDPSNPNEQLEIEVAIRSAKSMISKWEKPVQENLEKYTEFFSSLSGIKEIYAYGFSFSDIDWPYIRTILAYTPKQVTKIAGYHRTRDIVRAKRFFGDDVTLVRLNDIVLSSDDHGNV